MRLAPLVLVLAACATDPAEPGGGDAPPLPPITDPTDDDGDGIPEQLEAQLMERFGPELRLAPDDIDTARPANVDWYLERVTMRFDQPGCPDDEILAGGAVTLANLTVQRNFLKRSGLGLCQRSDDPADERFSNRRALEFFLQATDDGATHPGIPADRADEWRAYYQVRPSSYVTASGTAAAYDLQVWYFFPYNDNIASANHEGDWEHMTLSITEDLALASVFYATHDDGHRLDDLAAIELVDGTHPVGYVADGSHATYEAPGDHPGPAVPDHAYADGPRWPTWRNAINVGDIGHILGGQAWAGYGGRWGEVGELSFTSGPPGPMFQASWDTTTEY